jgi:hypothetical protein
MGFEEPQVLVEAARDFGQEFLRVASASFSAAPMPLASSR